MGDIPYLPGPRSSIKPPLAMLGGALACLCLLLPAGAAAAEDLPEFTPPIVAAPEAPVPGVVRDSVIYPEADRAQAGVASKPSGTPTSARRLIRAAATYKTADGHSVDVQISDGYADNPAGAQALVDYLGTLLHGDELGKLNVYVATALEIPTICGGIAAACYFPGDDTMVIVGEATFGGLPTNFVAAHEYGHHVENHRRNTPWDPLAWGTKRWATYEGICPRYLAGEIYPGDRFHEYPGSFEAFYWQNPGEAYAEAYAKYHGPFRNLLWEWIAGLRPDGGAYERIRQDVESPWRKNGTKAYGLKLRRGKSARKTFPVPLDGKLVIDLRGPKGANFDLFLRDTAGNLLARSKGNSSRERIKSFSCGDGKLKFIVDAVKGKGRAKVKVSKA